MLGYHVLQLQRFEGFLLIIDKSLYFEQMKAENYLRCSMLPRFYGNSNQAVTQGSEQKDHSAGSGENTMRWIAK